MGRARRFASRTAEEWREGRPGAHPANDESVTDWLPRFRRARRALIRKGTAAVLTVVVIVAGVVLVSARQSAQDRSQVEHDRAVEINNIETFVSGVRHLEFSRPVTVRFLSSDEFDRTPAADPAILRNYLVGLYPAFRALQLPTGPSDPTEVAQQVSKTVYGYYDHDVVVVRGTEINPFTRRVLAHEFTHALDDQNFDLEHVRRLVSPTVNALSVDALIEGDARRVENAFVAALPDDERALAVPSDASHTLAHIDIPDEVRTLVAFPYDRGVEFVAALAAAGGEPAVDAAFGDPPSLTHEVLHPEVYLDTARRQAVHDAVEAIPDPSPVGPVLVQPDMTRIADELFTELLLAPTVGADQAARAASTWNGDKAILWSTDSQHCVRIRYGPSNTQGTMLVEALTAWTAAHPGAQLDGSDLVSCT